MFAFHYLFGWMAKVPGLNLSESQKCLYLWWGRIIASLQESRGGVASGKGILPVSSAKLGYVWASLG